MTAAKDTPFRNRIVEQRLVRVGDIEGMAENFRLHPERQRKAAKGSMAELGFLDALDLWVKPDGTLCLFDGHMRRMLINANLGQDTMVPCNITDLTEDEARKALLVKDAIAGMAEIDEGLASALCDAVTFDNEELGAMMAGMKPEPVTAAPIPPVAEAVFKPVTAEKIVATEEKLATKFTEQNQEKQANIVEVACPCCQRKSYVDRAAVSPTFT